MKIVRGKDKKQKRIKVNPDKLNMSNTYSNPPEYYYDAEFDCKECGSHEIWTAHQQKWWYEEAGGYFFAVAVRCRECRKTERERN